MALTSSRSIYFNEYIIVQGYQFNHKFIAAYMRWVDGKVYIFDKESCFRSVMLRLDSDLNSEKNKKNKKNKKLIVSYNKEFKSFLPEVSDNISYNSFNDLIPVYSSWRPVEEFNLYQKLRLFKTEIVSQIERLTEHLPTSCLREIDKLGHRRTTATISRDLLNKWYKEHINRLGRFNKRRRPEYSWIREYAANLMKFNANNIINRSPFDEILYNCNKWDVNSMFPYQAFSRYTGKLMHGDVKYDSEFKHLYLTTEPDNVWTAEVQIKHNFVFTGIMDILDQALGDITGLRIKINNHIWNILVNDYHLTVDDIDVYDYWYCSGTQPFPPEIQYILKEMHTKKAEAKSRGDEIMKRYYKLPTHTLHGYANGKWFTEQDNEEAYNSIWDGSKFINARQCYTSLDSIILYTGAAETLCNALRKFRADEVYNYDTDMITVPAGKDEIFERLNKEVAKRYEEMGVNIEDVTHDGHTIGFWEKEAEYESLYVLAPKMYLYVEKGDPRLHSTTAGYPPDIIAQAIERKCGLQGTKALEWFYAQEDVILSKDDIGYCFNDNTGYMEPAQFSKKCYKVK